MNRIAAEQIALAVWMADIAANQQDMPADFAKILYNNRWELYE